MSENARLWGLRLLALVIALSLWWVAALEKRERPSERVLDASVTYLPPRGVILLDPIQSVKVRLRGSDRQIRNLNPVLVDVVIEIPAGRLGGLDIHLGPENVLRPDDLEVISVEPNTIRLEIDQEVTRLLPVEPRLTGEPAAGAVPGPARAEPETALASGPQTRLRDLGALTTGAVRLDGHALDFDETVTVLSPDPLIKVLQPTVVRVHVTLVRPEEEPPTEPRRRRP